MKLHSKIKNFCWAILLVAMGLFLAASCSTRSDFVFAEDETSEVEPHFVTIYDDGSYLTVKTSASTVKEVLERAEVELNDSDIVEPALDTVMGNADYNINIYRARPALVIDGANRHYLMTASYDPKQIMYEAGVTVYDGDEISAKMNDNFLETGVASTYEITRNGGRTLTEEEAIGYPTETRYDYSLAKGEQHLEQAGEDGRISRVYEVKFENNREVARELISEEVKREPVTEIIVIGAKASIPPSANNVPTGQPKRASRKMISRLRSTLSTVSLAVGLTRLILAPALTAFRRRYLATRWLVLAPIGRRIQLPRFAG